MESDDDEGLVKNEIATGEDGIITPMPEVDATTSPEKNIEAVQNFEESYREADIFN